MHHSNFWELALIGSSSSLHSGIWFSCDPPLVHKIGTTYYLLPLPTNPQLYQPFAKVPQAEEWLKLFKVPNWIEPFNFLKYLIMFPIWLPCPIAISIFLQGQTSYEVIQMCNPRLAFLVSPRIGVPWNLDELWPRDVTGIMLFFLVNHSLSQHNSAILRWIISLCSQIYEDCGIKISRRRGVLSHGDSPKSSIWVGISMFRVAPC